MDTGHASCQFNSAWMRDDDGRRRERENEEKREEKKGKGKKRKGKEENGEKWSRVANDDL